MDHKKKWAYLLHLCFICNHCMGDGLTLKSVDERDIRKVDFEPKEKTEYENDVVFKPKNPEKEMLLGSVVWRGSVVRLSGSVVWFGRTEEIGAVNSRNNKKVTDVIRLRSNSGHRQNKSLDTEKDKTEKIMLVSPGNRRENKSIEQNKQTNVVESIKNDKKNHSEEKTSQKNNNRNNGGNNRQNKNKQQNKAHKRQQNQAKNRQQNQAQGRRQNLAQIKNQTQIANQNKNIQLNLVLNKQQNQSQNQQQNRSQNKKQTLNKRTNPDKAKVSEPAENEKKIVKDMQPENKSNIITVQNVKEEVRTSSESLVHKPKGRNIKADSTGIISSQEKEIIQEVKTKIAAQIKDKVVQKIKEVDKQNKVYNAESSKNDEIKPLTEAQKHKVVENADLLGLLLAKSDPDLVRVLIDNSSPENLNVFLNHSNITLEELKDIVAY